MPFSGGRREETIGRTHNCWFQGDFSQLGTWFPCSNGFGVELP